MTQTPRGFDPQDPHGVSDAPATPYPASASAAGAPAGAPSGAVEQRPSDEAIEQRPPAGGPAAPTVPAAPTGPATGAGEHRKVTRAGMVWTAVASALVVMALLIVFILQNQVYVQVKFFGLEGSVPLGVALFIAAVGGGALVAIAGAARIIQLRFVTHRQRARLAGQGARTR